MKFLHDKQPDWELTYSDVFMVPQLTNVRSRFDVDLTSPDPSGLHIPIIVSNMTAVAGRRMAETVARRGGLTVLTQDIPLDVLKTTVDYIKSCNPLYETPITLKPENHIHEALSLIHKRSHKAVIIVNNAQKPVGIFTEDDAALQDRFARLDKVMTPHVITLPDGITAEEAYERLSKERLSVAPIVKKNGQLAGVMTLKGALRSTLYKPLLDTKGRLKVAVAVGINGDVAAKAQALIKLGVDILVLDTAHGHQTKMIEAVQAVRKVAPSITIVAGNVATAEATEALIRAGANIVKVGIGPGAMCTTRMMTGVGRPQFSAVAECAAAAEKLGGFVWADGGVRHPRDVALALAAGASGAMFASWFAGTYESAADVLYDADGRMYKESFGMASRRAVIDRNKNTSAYDKAKKELFEEGVSTSKLYIDSENPGVEDIIDQIIAGVRSSCTYAGARSIKEFQDRAVIGIQSAAGYQEGLPQQTTW